MEQVWKNGPQDGYTWFAQMKECYDALVDEQSKEIFQARVMLDLELRIEHYNILWKYLDLDVCKKINQIIEQKIPVYIYGLAASGKYSVELFQKLGMKILGIYDRNYKEIISYHDIPVLAPPTIKTDVKDNELIIICTPNYYQEIYDYLSQLGITQDRILIFDRKEQSEEEQYFDFMDHYVQGTDFIDAGCLNCHTAFLFHQKCKGCYGQIIAFEPDPENYKQCQTMQREYHLENCRLIQAGLGKENEVVHFTATHNGSSTISPEGTEQIRLVTLDSIVNERKVGFIKMDIEGAELDALQGSAKTIKRDKPLCAISVYHKPGDVIVIMQYLKHLVPEYQFALRHYKVINETVLYAFI